MALRQAGLTVPVLCLLAAPGRAARGRPSATTWTCPRARLAWSARSRPRPQRAGKPARLHLKADTGMSPRRRDRRRLARPGRPPRWPRRPAGRAAHRRDLVAPGLRRHARAPVDRRPARGVPRRGDGGRAGRRRPEVRHLANTPATLTLPEAWFDLVRPGGGVFGLSTLPGGAPDWLRPAMTVRARLVQVKRVPAGAGVSYGHRYVTGRRDHARAGAARLRRGHAAAAPRARRRCRSRAAVDDLPARSA